jgi:hypothetical protein
VIVGDLVVLLMTFGFFVLCVAYVALCDRVVGPDDPDAAPRPDDAAAVDAVATEVAR